MRAFLLAAGKGMRLRPVTRRVPKCLVPIEGTTLLGIWFRLLQEHGVTSVLLNTHHLADQVSEYVESHALPGLEVILSYEPKLLGTAGTVMAHRSFVKGEKNFFILYADNLTDMNLTDFHDFHCRKSSPFTVGLFRTPHPESCGIATCDAEGRIVQFVEKPHNPSSNLANSGLYIAGPDVFDLIPRKPFVDFGYDVLHLMIGKMYGYTIEGFFRDLGTPERLEQARKDWPRVLNMPVSISHLS